MLLVLLVILIASVVLYMGFKKAKSINEKILMISAYVLLICLVFKYMMTYEGFQVKMDDEEFINSVEKLDNEADEKFNDTKETNKDNSKDNTESSFNPTLVVNIPDEQENGDTKIVIKTPTTDPFKPDEELFKGNCSNTEYFKDQKHITSATMNKVEKFNDDPAYVPYVDNSVSGYRLYTSKDFVPGMAFIPPTEWEVPQPHKTSGDCNLVCAQTMPNTRQLPIAMMDYGTPINALELGPDGLIAKREEDAPLTSVGSLMPKFEYREYVDCHRYNTSNNSPGMSMGPDRVEAPTTTTA
jgi:hypothetical protein